MGHVRLAKMPATLKWKQVIALLGDQPSIPRLADAVQRACDKSLSNAVRDPGFIEALWLMMQIPKAANSADFKAELNQLGIHVREPDIYRSSGWVRRCDSEGAVAKLPNSN